MLWKLGEQGGLDIENVSALFASLIIADIIALLIAFPALRKWKWCWVATLPVVWTLAFYFTPSCPVWLMRHPLFFLRVPAALLIAAITALALSRVRLRGRFRYPITAIVFLSVAGGSIVAPFADDLEVPRRVLARDAPAFMVERMIDDGKFEEITKLPIPKNGLRRLEIAYRALAAFRMGQTDNPSRTSGAQGWETTTIPHALMDGFKYLYAYGFVLQARRLILELRGETEGRRKLIHDRYLGDIAFICGERRLAEHHYRLLAKSRIFRETALARIEAVQSGKTPFDIPELSDVATLYLVWKKDAQERNIEYFQHEQNLEQYVYTHFNEIKASTLAPLEIEPVVQKTIDPEFNGAEIPWNIAPMNFDLIGKTDADCIRVSMSTAYGERIFPTTSFSPKGGEHPENRIKVTFEEDEWSKFLSKHRGETLTIDVRANDRSVTNLILKVSNDAIDRAVTFRLIEPSYGVFGEMSIVERDLSSFRETVLDHNHDEQPGERRCMNCHTTLKDGKGTFMRHLRGKNNGTLVHSAKYGQRFHHLPKNAGNESVTYPAWHPSGDFIAFSMNRTRQSFKHVNPQKIEVFDITSSLALFDVANGSITPIPSSPNEKECYPAWDPTGHLLFTSCCVSNDVYDLRVRRFHPGKRLFTKPETVIDGNLSKLSVLHTRVSPDGFWAVVTVTAEGVFPIWHRDADLYVINLNNRTARLATELNSPEADTFHNFSSNGRWLVFASRRDNGTVTRLYLAHFDPATGIFGRPFRLPTADPEAEAIRRFSYNAPDFAP